MKTRLTLGSGIAALACAASPQAFATSLTHDSGFRLAPPSVVSLDLASAVRSAISAQSAGQPVLIAKAPVARHVPKAFDDMPDTNFNYSPRNGGPEVELGVLGSEIGRPKGLVHFAVDWEF